MKKPKVGTEDATLAGLGVTAAEERAYVALLRRDGATAAELAAQLREPRRAASALLDALAGKGLATHSPAKVRRYFAVPPDIAVEALIERRQSELQHARGAIARLRAAASRPAGGQAAEERLVEVLSPEASVSAISQMIKYARSEILCLERQPLLISPAGVFEEAHSYTLGKGVRSRSVTDRDLMRVPGMLETLRREVAAGEEKRVFTDLPFKLIVVDRRIAVVPLALESPTGLSLLVRSPALLRAFEELFEMFWRLSTPYGFDADGRLRIEPLPAPDGDPLLALLASGLNDKTIEQELGVSSRTFTRRVTALMKRLGATTRFHAGWLASESRHAAPRK